MTCEMYVCCFVDDVFELMTFVDNTASYYNASDVIDDRKTLCDIIEKANLRWKIRDRSREKEVASTAVDKDVRRQ